MSKIHLTLKVIFLMPSLIKKAQNTCFQNNLFANGDKIILAVSGGPDSVCMLDFFTKLQKKYSLKLIIAHVNYNLRGKDSIADKKFVRDLAKKYDIKIFVLDLVETQDFASLHTKKNISENYLRNIRYDFFEKLRIENNFNLIAVAHNADDQVETYLMRIIRGTGLSGLSAMKFRNKFIIRPLLSTPRQEILDYLKINKLKYRTDKTNIENKYLRNKVRNKLLLKLEKDFNPRIRKTIFNSSISISEDLSFLEEVTEKYLKNKDKLEISQLKKLHPAILRRVLRNIIKNEKGDLKNISAKNIEEIIKIIKSTKNKTQVVILSGLKITRRNDKLKIS